MKHNNLLRVIKDTFPGRSLGVGAAEYPAPIKPAKKKADLDEAHTAQHRR
jgi:hypothetical protein